jgi:hypothetical protein
MMPNTLDFYQNGTWAVSMGLPVNGLLNRRSCQYWHCPGYIPRAVHQRTERVSRHASPAHQLNVPH